MSHTICVFIKEFKYTLVNIIIDFNICQLYMRFLPGLVDILHIIMHFYPDGLISCCSASIKQSVFLQPKVLNKTTVVVKNAN